MVAVTVTLNSHALPSALNNEVDTVGSYWELCPDSIACCHQPLENLPFKLRLGARFLDRKGPNNRRRV